jgi:uncharacterized protein DUF4157/lysine-specific metallo-endopeptidase family protein
MQERVSLIKASAAVTAGVAQGRLVRPLQRKLKIGAIDDPLEREADRLANRVVHGPDYKPLNTTSTGLTLSRKCGCGGSGETAGACEECSKKQETIVQRRPASANAHGIEPTVVHDTLNSPGQPLAPRERAFFEPKFGHDFSRIRIHNDSQASASAQAVEALAYTVGRDIVFRQGQYRPDTSAGRVLLAHELVHTIQQSTSSPQGAVDLLLMRQAAPPAYGPACSGGARDPCQLARCDANQKATIPADLRLAIRYADAAVSALNRSPLDSDTVTALNWFFNAHDKATAAEVQRRLGCIRSSLADTQANSRYGCDLDDSVNLAYVCVGNTPICTDKLVDVCVTKQHFKENARTRAETLIHECAHRVGMSLGAPRSVPDIYRFTSRFLNLSTSDALQNSDSLALFAGAVTEGVRISLLPILGLSGGTVLTRGPRTWQARLYVGTELQHPVLRIFNPTVGIGISLVGNPGPGVTPGISPDPTFLASLVAGVRIADPRPGGAGGPYLSVFGGPALAVSGTKTDIGAEAGVGLGYRWRWLDVSVGAALVHDPTREPGRQNLVPITGQITFTPGAR